VRGSQRETAALPCATSARQRPKNARQTLCRAFSVGAHGKGRTVAFCTVNPLCRASWLTTHGRQSLPCVFPRRTAKKATNGTGAKRRGTPFAVRREKNARQTFVIGTAKLDARQRSVRLCAPIKTHGKVYRYRAFLFDVRHLENARQSRRLPCAR
jgi:hypothetical protein